MATVTGTFAINFAGLGDANPYTNADFIPLNSSSARIASGVFRAVDAGTPAQFLLDPAEYTGGDTITSKIEVSNAGGGFDAPVVGVLDASGNGYRVSVHSWGVQRHRLDAHVPHTDSGVEDFFTVSNADTFEVQYTKSTGALTVTYNGTERTGLALSNTTHADKTLAPYFGATPGDNGAGGIISFAADGITASGTNYTLDIDVPADAAVEVQNVDLGYVSGYTLPVEAAAGVGEASGDIPFQLASPFDILAVAAEPQDIALLATVAFNLVVDAIEAAAEVQTSVLRLAAVIQAAGVAAERQGITLSWSEQTGVDYSGQRRYVYVVNTSGRVRWVDYLPVTTVVVEAEKLNRYDNDGALAIQTLTDVTGLTPWVDYIPVVEVDRDPRGRWTYNDNGFIPVCEVTDPE